MLSRGNTRERCYMVVEALTTLRLLRTGRWMVGDLAEELRHTRRTAYRLLAAIERAGIRLERHREGRCVYYRVRRAELERAMGLLRSRRASGLLPRQAEAVRLYQEGLSLQGVADRLALTSTAVRHRLVRAGVPRRPQTRPTKWGPACAHCGRPRMGGGKRGGGGLCSRCYAYRRYQGRLPLLDEAGDTIRAPRGPSR
jgi:hypothetical protein